MATQIRTLTPAAISQRDLDVIIGLDNQIRALQQMRNERCADLLSRILSGQEVEPGCHSANLNQAGSGAFRSFRLCLDGREMS
jgi:hypothetical protein